MLSKVRTKDVAKSRLSGVLRQDRTTLTRKDLALMQLDVLAALSGYVEMTRERASLSVVQGEEGAELVFTVPVENVKRGRRGGAAQ